MVHVYRLTTKSLLLENYISFSAETKVYHLEEDIIRPGHLLFTDGRMLMSLNNTSPENALEYTFGDYTPLFRSYPTKGYYDPYLMTGFAQVPSSAKVILLDHRNECLLQFDREHIEIEHFALECKNNEDARVNLKREYRYMFCDSYPGDNHLNYPTSILIDVKQPSRLFITDTENCLLRALDMDTKNMSTVSCTVERRFHMVQDPASGDLFTTCERGIGRYDYAKGLFQLFSGHFRNLYLPGFSLKFDMVTGLCLLNSDSLVVADFPDNKLHVLHLSKNTTTPLYVKELNGTAIPLTFSMLYSNGTLYLGTDGGGIKALQGKNL